MLEEKLKMEQSKTYTISFAGDTSLGEWHFKRKDKVKLLSRLENDPFSFFSGIKPLIEKSDYFFLNLETVLDDSPNMELKRIKNPYYENPERTIEILKDLGVSAVSLANDRSMGFGIKGLSKTIRKLKKEKIRPLGAAKCKKNASKPYKFYLKGRKGNQYIYLFTGLKVRENHSTNDAFVKTFKPGVSTLPIDEISNIRKKDPKSIIIIFPHWKGYDYKLTSEYNEVKESCRELIDAGANYIFGHGTHMLDNFEYYNGGTIVYSIGNFVFNSPGKYKKLKVTPVSLIVNLEIQETNDGDWDIKEKFHPIMSNNKRTKYHPYKINIGVRDYFTLKDLSNTKNNQLNVIDWINDNTFSSKISKDKATFTTKKLVDEFSKKGIKTKIIKRGSFEALLDDTVVRFISSRPSTESREGRKIIGNKQLTKTLLEKEGLTVAKGKTFNFNQEEDALDYARTFNSVVIKPRHGHQGRGVTVGVSNEEEFSVAWKEALQNKKKHVLIEEEFTGGKELRYLVIGGKYAAAILRIPPSVIGNGIDTIEELIHKKNQQRALNPNLTSKLIKINSHRKSLIKKQGYELQDVLEKDKELLIDSKAGLTSGGEPMDMTDKVHESFKRIAERAATAIPGLEVVGVDLLAKDHSKPATKDNYIVIEINTRPGLGGHLYPVHGTSRNVAKTIVEYMISKYAVNNEIE